MRSRRLFQTLEVLAVFLTLTAFGAEAHGVILGTVRDVESQSPLPDVVITATSPSLPGEATVVTDARGNYHIPELPPGRYTLRFEKEHYKPYARSDIPLRAKRMVRVTVGLLRENEVGEIIIMCGPGPASVDTSSTATSWRPYFLDNVQYLAVNRPPGRDGAVRASESLSEFIPQVVVDVDGSAINGASAFENEYLLDGLSTRDAASGLNALPLTTEFLQDVSILTAGFPAKNGRATGGVFETTAKSGSNELHGSVFAHWVPGVLEGETASTPGRGALKNLGDFGATLGGPLVKDRLWFFAGVAPTLGRREHTHTPRTFFVDERGVQAMAKLTYLPDRDHNVSLAVITAPTHERVASPAPEPWERDTNTVLTSLQYRGALLDRYLLVEANAGWLHQGSSLLSERDGAASAGALPLRELDGYQANARSYYLWRGPGVHVLQAGVDTGHFVHARTRAVAGEAPGRPTLLESRTTSTLLGAFVQDSWMFWHRFTLNAGLRYDVQRLDAGAGATPLIAMPQLSPRVGLVVDLWRNGQAKVFAHHATHRGVVPLGLLDGPVGTTPEAVAVDPGLAPASTRELVAGFEMEVLSEALVSVAYTHRDLDTAPALVRVAGVGGVVLGNPGRGLASNLPAAKRTHDAVTVGVRHGFTDGWLAEVSYTLSRLSGNHAGPFLASTGQDGYGLPVSPLPVVEAGGTRRPLADRPHVLRIFGARELNLSSQVSTSLGLSYFGMSGMPLEGAPGRTPWVHTFDARFAVSYRVTRREVMSFQLEAFNLLDSQVMTHGAQETPDEGALPVPARYQAPREVRLGVRYVF
ncbi:TonB-dependent receptor [Pyxidicoccus trucidator]|uniref:TonB-dependent receptor n=1 Tax=Pyxidicoccus trucidator TaxID=2709662 RepID=UPI0013DA9BB8|nr:TonB-dependent receptor [Pyxidicoccus trucidator]